MEATTVNQTLLRELAAVGAHAKVSELEAQIRAIHAAFPKMTVGAVIPAKRRRVTAKSNGGRRRLTVAEKKAISARMKRYWAAQRKV